MKKPKICYKVVTEDMMSICSLFDIDMPKLPVKYIENVWTKPNIEGTALFVFTTQRDAERFANREIHHYSNKKDLHIYKCHIRGKMKHHYLCDISALDKFIDLIQDTKKRKKSLISLMFNYRKMSVPLNTMSVGQIKLTSKVGTIFRY